MNKIILVGRLTADPEVRYTQSGKAVASFNLAVNRYVGQGQQQADFIPVVVWDKLAEVIGNNLTKGQRVLVEGRLQIRTYEAQDGQKRRVAEVVTQNIEFLERKQQQQGGNSGEDRENLTADSFGQEVFPEEQIPF